MGNMWGLGKLTDWPSKFESGLHRLGNDLAPATLKQAHSPLVEGLGHLASGVQQIGNVGETIDQIPQYLVSGGKGKSGRGVSTAAAASAAPAATDPIADAVSVWSTPQGFNLDGFRKDVLSTLAPKDQKDPAKVKAAVDTALSQAGFKKAWTGNEANATGVSQAISPAVMQMYMAGLTQNMGEMQKQFAGSSDASMQKMNDAYKAMGVTPSPTTNALNLERANLGQNMAQNALMTAENAPFVNQFLQSLNQNNSLIQQLVREQQYAAAKNNVLPGGQIPGVNTSGIGAATGIPGLY